MTLQPDDLKRLSHLLDAAMDLDGVALEPWLAALPPDDRPLAPRLREMLAGRAARAGSSSAAPAQAVWPACLAPATSSVRTGCCAGSAKAAWARCGWPSAPTAPSSGRWR
jgi:hypothetical protein